MQTVIPIDPAAALARLDPSLRGAVWHPLAGGRTNRVWRVGDLVVKSFSPDAETPLFPNDCGAEARALAAFAPLGIAPRLQAKGDDWLIYDHVPGTRWQEDAAAVARALYRLHQSGIAAGFRSLPNGTQALRQDALRVAGGMALPPLPDVPSLPPVTPRPVHADAVAGNVVMQGQMAVLIDWQCPGLGDPAEDLATFLSPLMQWLYTGRVIRPEERQRFLDAYPDSETRQRFLLLEPLYDWRMRAHCAHRAARGDQDYARALTLVSD